MLRSAVVPQLIPVLLGTFLLIGCGSSSPSGRVPVAGTIKLDGAPLVGAEVYFIADEEGYATRTDKDGYYQFLGGIKPLKYRVSLSKFEGKGVEMSAESGIDEGQLAAMQMADPSGKTLGAVAKQLIPAKFNDRNKTELSFTVPLEGTQSADFDLSSH